MKDKIRQVVADVLMVDVSDITDDSSPDTIDRWDSMTQMNIIVALEEEFNIHFSDGDIVDMLNFKLIQEITQSYL